jgi:outer membrane protein assembly factor BamB
MDPKNILVLGIHGSLVAFRRDTGEKLWSLHLKSSGFVSVATDEKRVYAHTGGELFCVDLFSGGSLWHDGLKGLGYGLGSLAGMGLGMPAAVGFERYRQQQADAASASTTSSGG